MPLKVTRIQDTNSFEAGNVSFPIGNAGQWKKRNIQFEAGVNVKSSQSNTITIRPQDADGFTEVERLQGSWVDDGFEVGDLVRTITSRTVQGSPPTIIPSSVNVISVTDTVLLIDTFNFQQPRTYPSQYQQNDGSNTLTIFNNWIELYKDVAYTEIEFKFNQIDNDSYEGASMNSIYDGSQAVIRATNIDANNLVFALMEQIGNKSGSTILNPRIKGRGFGTGNNSWKNLFELEFVYKVSGEFQDVSNYIDNTTPEWYLNNNCITNNFIITLRSEESNPNLTVQNDTSSDITKLLGNTGWKNENYNGIPTNSEITDVEFRVNNSIGDIITEPLFNNDTYVKITLNDPDANTLLSKYAFQFTYIPQEESQYKLNEFSESGNLLINCINEFNLVPLTHTGAPVIGVFSGFENNVSARMDVVDPHLQIAGTTVTLELILRPNDFFANYFQTLDENNRLISLQMSVGKPSSTQQSSNRARLIAGNYQMQRFLLDRGEYPLLDSRFLQHNETELDTGTLNPFGYIQDDLKQYALIPVNKNNDFIINRIRTEIIIENNTTGESGVLESNFKDLSTYPVFNDPILGDIIEVNTGESLKGYNLSQDNKNNWFRLNRRSDLDTLNFWYLEYWYGFKLRFEDWVFADNLPDGLYQETQQLNNFNQNWYNKQDLSGWQIKYKFYVEVSETYTNPINGFEYTDFSTFTNTFPVVTIVDYEGGDLLGTAESFNENNDSLLIGSDPSIDNKNINGLIDGEKVKYTFSFNSVNPINDISDIVYAYVDLYEWRQGTVFGAWQLSTAVDNLTSGNPIEPTENSIGNSPEIVLVDPNNFLVCVNINADNLPQSADSCYSINCRVQTTDGVLVGGKIKEDGTQKITESNDNKIIE